MVHARRASYNEKMLAQQVIPLAPGYRTALSSHPGTPLFISLIISSRPPPLKKKRN